MKIAKLTLVLLLAASLSFIGCLGDDDSPEATGSIVGKWLLTDVTIDGAQQQFDEYYYVFEEDSTGEQLDMDNNSVYGYTWSVEGDKITFNNLNGGSMVRDYSVTSTKLILELISTYDEYTEHFKQTFTRQ